MGAKKINITIEQIDKWQSSLKYKWRNWYQYTWLGKAWFSAKSGVPSLFKWFKIAWKDRDYDYRFIYDALRFKLDNTLKYIDKHERSVNYKQDVFWMQTCADLIDKLVGDDSYDTEYMDYQKTEMIFEDIEGKEDLCEIKFETLEDNLDEYFAKYPLWHKRAIEYIKKNQSRYSSDHNSRSLQAHIMAKLRHDRARKLLFEIMERKIETFWD